MAVKEWIQGVVGALREAAERVVSPAPQRVPVAIPVPVRSPRPYR